MSDEDFDGIMADGAGGRMDRDRRAPRFSWTPSYEATFFRSLCDSVSLGLRENNSFKAEAWERAAAALQATHGAFPTKSHLINKSDNARKRFRLWRGLREDPSFLYNSVAKTVTATEDAWRAHIEVSVYMTTGRWPREPSNPNTDAELRKPTRKSRCPEPFEADLSITKNTWRFSTPMS